MMGLTKMIPKPEAVDAAPLALPRAPFASESSLQRFVEHHAEATLGLKVVGSARQRGASVLKIDILAADSSERAWVIECKHDLVDSRALEQLRRYRSDLLSQWDAVKTRVADRCQVQLSEDEPGLILIGYRYDDTFVAEREVCLSYRYHDVEFTDDELQTQRSGRVSFHRVDFTNRPTKTHPRVSKKIATLERLDSLLPALAQEFLTIDSELLKDKRVKVTYGGKNFVRYRTRKGVFAEAVIGRDSIDWQIRTKFTLESREQTPDLLAILCEASTAR